MIPLSALPSVNAALNATSALLLIAGYGFIRAKRLPLHVACMLSACATSLAFLVSYLIYHAQVGATPFPGQGWIRVAYFTILISHTVLAAVILPLVGRTLWLAIQRRFDAHERLARVTLPLWLYVSVTGVLVYLMLYHAPLAHACPMCKEALLDPAGAQTVTRAAKGYAMSIAALVGMPFVLVGGVAMLIVRASRRRDANLR